MTPVQLKTRARNAVQSAIERGDLSRPSVCEKCGQPPSWLCKLDGHHDDYTKPLDVRWLCRSCHQLHHLSLVGRRRAPPKAGEIQTSERPAQGEAA